MIQDTKGRPAAVFDTDIGNSEISFGLDVPPRPNPQFVRASLTGHKSVAETLHTQLIFDPTRLNDLIRDLQPSRPIIAGLMPLVGAMARSPYTRRSNPPHPVAASDDVWNAWSSHNLVLLSHLTTALLELDAVNHFYTRLNMQSPRGSAPYIYQHVTAIRVIQSILRGELLDPPDTKLNAPDAHMQRQVADQLERIMSLVPSLLELQFKEMFKFDPW